MRAPGSRALPLLLVVVVVVAYPMAAQVANSDGSDTQEPPKANSQTVTLPVGVLFLRGEDQGENEVVPSGPIGVPSLLWGQSIALIPDAMGHALLYGANMAQGYVLSPHTGGDAVDGSFSLLTPYLGLQHAGPKAMMVFQYSPAIAVYAAHEWDGRMFHHSRFDLVDDLSPRLIWRNSASNGYGDESVRLITPLVTELSSMVLQSSNQQELDIAGSSTLAWHRTPHQNLAFSVNESYYSLGNGPIVSGRVNLAQTISGRSAVSAFAQVHHFISDSGCTEFGAGVGVSTSLGAKTRVGVEGGPEHSDSSACGYHWGGNFFGDLTTPLTLTTRLMLGVGRDLSSSFLIGTRWTDSAMVGLSQQIDKAVVIQLNAGYIHASGFSNSVGEYKGYTFSPEVRWHMRPDLDLINSYRLLQREAGQGGSNQAMSSRSIWLTVQWHPSSRT